MKETVKKRKAVFLDRDGVINHETGNYVFMPEDFVLNRGITEILTRFRRHGYMLIVITNQSGIALGRYTHDHVDRIHDLMKKQFAGHDIDFAEIYYCPHHPSTGKCLCRKPGSLLVEKAVARFHIDPALSWMIGDKERDIEAAQHAGVKGLLIKTNEPLLQHADIILNDC